MPNIFNQQGFSQVIVSVVVLAAVMVVGLVGWRVYESSITTSQQESQIPEDHSAQSPDWFQIKELGIDIELPAALRDDIVLHSTTQAGNTFVAFSTRSITAQYPQCGASSGDAPLGVLVRTVGQYPANANVGNATGNLVKQFPDYYIAYRDPSQPCTQEAAAQTAIQNALAQFKGGFESITVTP